MKKITSILLTLCLTLALVACGKAEPILTMNHPLEELMGAYEATLLAGQSADTMILTSEELEDRYAITPDMYVQYAGRQSIDLDQWCDEYMFLEVADGQVDPVVEALQAYPKSLSASSELSEEHQEQVNAYKVYVRENFVVFAFGIGAEECIEYFTNSFVEE